MTTYSDGNVTEVVAVAVDTETQIFDITIPSGKGGRIKKLRFSCTAASASNGFLELKLGSHSGPFRFAVPAQVAEQILLLCAEIDVDMEVFANERVQLFATLNVAGVDAMGSITWVAA